MMQWLSKRSLPFRLLAYAGAAILLFAVAAGMGAMGALILRSDQGSSPAREEPRLSDEQENAPASQQQKEAAAEREEAAAEPEEATPQQREAEYVSEVGEIQGKSVETFLDSHGKLLRYDALTADDVEEMQTNQATLQEFTDQVDDLSPPQKYREHYEVFRSALGGLHEAAQIAYALAADPTAATQAGFEEYDRLVNEAATDLQRSNEILDRDYKTIEGVQGASPLS